MDDIKAIPGVEYVDYIKERLPLNRSDIFEITKVDSNTQKFEITNLDSESYDVDFSYFKFYHKIDDVKWFWEVDFKDLQIITTEKLTYDEAKEKYPNAKSLYPIYAMGFTIPN